MHRHWEKVILPLMKQIRPKHIVEIGSAKGINTRKILDFCKNYNCKLTSIDPKPNFDINEFKNEFGEKFEIYEDLSLNVLPVLDDFDVILIDGDHNWYTVFNELKTIEDLYKKNNNFPLIIFHDICWPYGRRDLYYNPDTIPKEFLLPYDELGMIPNQSELSKGIGLNYRGFKNAIFEGGSKNGVLTAIEDYMDMSHLDFFFYSIPAYHGLGILFMKDNNIKNIVESIIDYPLIMEDLEKHYLKTITVDMRIRKNQLIEKNKKMDKTVRVLTDEKVVLENKNVELDEVVRVLTDEKVVLENKNVELDEVVRVLTDEKVVLENKNVELDKTIHDLNNKIKKINLSNELEIKNITTKNMELKKDIVEKINQIDELNKKVSEIILNNEIKTNKLIESKNNEIKNIITQNQKSLDSINEDFEKFRVFLEKNENKNKVLIDENNLIKKSICEKDSQIKYLKEEMKILNSIIKEKNETINYFETVKS